MTRAELDRLWQHSGGKKIVSAEIMSGPGPWLKSMLDRAPHVMATLDDGRLVELFSFWAHERSFTAEEFVGLTVDEGRRLKFSPDHRLDLGPRTSPARPV